MGPACRRNLLPVVFSFIKNGYRGNGRTPAEYGHRTSDIGVAEVGLPPSNLDDPTRNVLLEYYSIKDVFTREINDVWPGLDQSIIDAYLFNTEAPGFFGTDGFIAGGTSPGEDWDVLADRLQDLSPYNPKEISNLNIDFK